MALCEFFYQQSQDYRILMSMFNSLQSGVLSEDGHSLILSQSILTGSIASGRFDIFKVLCAQSTINNICGAVIEDKVIPLLDLACSINPMDDRFAQYLREWCNS